MHTGTLIYKDINFFFSLVDDEFEMYPFKEEEDKARSLVDTPIDGGWSYFVQS